MLDLTNAEVDKLKTYDGANGGKISVIYNDTRYMVKFPPSTDDKLNLDVSYINSCISEHIASSIFNSLGIEAHNTFLANYTLHGKNKLVVACEDFEKDGFRFRNFIGVRNACVSSNGTCVELSEVLNTIQEQEILPPETVTKRFWDMFTGDALLGNFDRHNGNWGFLINEQTRETKLAPVFDCGSCLFARLSDEEIKNKVLPNQAEIDQRIYVFPPSALRLNDKKINYHDFLETTDNLDCLRSLEEVTSNIDSSKIESIVNDCLISDERKEFYLTMIHERESKILINALIKNPNIKHTFNIKSPTIKQDFTEKTKSKPNKFNILPPNQSIAEARKEVEAHNELHQSSPNISHKKHHI